MGIIAIVMKDIMAVQKEAGKISTGSENWIQTKRECWYFSNLENNKKAETLA